MMNSYFEQSGFYNGPVATTTAEQQSYRFPQSLLVPPYGAQSGPRAAHEATTTPYADPNTNGAAACKIYSDTTVFKAECLAKEANGFSQAVKDMVNWSARAANEQMRTFAAENQAAAPRGDAWQQCCQNSPAVAQTPSNAFYPWMAIAGLYLCLILLYIQHAIHSNVSHVNTAFSHKWEKARYIARSL